MKSFKRKIASLIMGLIILSGITPAEGLTDSDSACTGTCSKSMDLSIGADIVSRYIWRGNEYGGSPAVPQIQPSASLEIPLAGSAGLLTLGLWASYGLTGDYAENDFSITYSLPTSIGEFSLSATDYYFPSASGPLFSNFKGKGEGAHTVEAALGYNGPELLPVKFLISNNIHNDTTGQNSLYFEAGYPLQLGQVSLNLFAGAARGVSTWYSVSTEKFEITNIGFTAGKEIKISGDLSLPAELSFIYNPHIKNSFVVFKLSI